MLILKRTSRRKRLERPKGLKRKGANKKPKGCPAGKSSPNVKLYNGSLNEKYSKLRTNQLLGYMNNLNSGDKRLKGYEPSMDKVKHVITASGHLKSLEDLITIVGLSRGEAVGLCDKVVAVMIKKKKMQLCYPTLSLTQVQNVQSVVSIHNSLSCVSWAHLETSGCLLNWDMESFLIPENQKHALDCVSLALKFRDKLPVGDLYFVESLEMKQSNRGAEGAEILLTNSLRHALLTVAGCRQLECGKSPMLYAVNRLLAPSLFHLSVGRETVARYQTVENILEESKYRNEAKRLYDKLVIDDWLRDRFAACNVYEKEELSQPLLATIAFMNVVIKKNSPSLEQLPTS